MNRIRRVLVVGGLLCAPPALALDAPKPPSYLVRGVSTPTLPAAAGSLLRDPTFASPRSNDAPEHGLFAEVSE